MSRLSDLAQCIVDGRGRLLRHMQHAATFCGHGPDRPPLYPLGSDLPVLSVTFSVAALDLYASRLQVDMFCALIIGPDEHSPGEPQRSRSRYPLSAVVRIDSLNMNNVSSHYLQSVS